jgi:hypothetical protein
MGFDIDFSDIPWVEIKKLGISLDEVFSVFENPSSSIASSLAGEFIVGFSNKRKFVVITYKIAKNANFDIEVIQIELPYEEDIKKFWCLRNK